MVMGEKGKGGKELGKTVRKKQLGKTVEKRGER
jgi:hypothetical protein